ncbi:MAG TPA: spore germination protein, partial [Firmicutes bacterium]|nr:spore germination protein [Bacillota bacterium]
MNIFSRVSQWIQGGGRGVKGAGGGGQEQDKKKKPLDQEAVQLPERFSTSLGENLELIKRTLGRSSDVLIREFNIAGRKDLRAC